MPGNGDSSRSAPHLTTYRVPVKDPSGRGRRVCGTCKQLDGRTATEIDRELCPMHGGAFDERDWKRYGWSRPKPTGKPFNSKTGR